MYIKVPDSPTTFDDAGFSQDAAGVTFAFLHSHGVMRNLGDVAPGTTNSAAALNNHGDVVGTSVDSTTQVSSAYLYHEGKMVDLNTLIPPHSGWVLQQATGINDAGQICGVGINPQGNPAAFRIDLAHD
jgi:probable HAF family extracellular repeat protein